MFYNGRKNICVVLSDPANHYQEQVCKTLTSLARARGYNLAYFACFTSYGVNTKNGRGQANIINLIPYEKFDGFIIYHDTFADQQAVDQMFDFVKQRAKGPVVTVRRAREEYPCVLSEDYGSIRKIVQHLIDVHGFDQIGFMSGPEEHPDAQTRLRDYREGLESRGIAYEEKLVFYGDFWRRRAKEAVRYFTKELPERPQAVVCANDYMALSLCDELINTGILIPEDIVVTGFDDIGEATTNMPPLTTVTVQAGKMSEVAFDTLEKLMRGEDVPMVQNVNSEPVFRNSCGCHNVDFASMAKKRVMQNKENENIKELMSSNTHMTVEMSEADRAEDLVERTRILNDPDNFVQNFFICLGEGRGEVYPKYHSTGPGYPDRFHSVGSVINRRIVQTEPFDGVDLVPREAAEREPMIYYFFTLHNLDRTFGYFAINYKGVHSCEKTFHTWLAIVGNALENLRLRQKNKVLLDELNNLYVHDALTGLLNRRGFEYSSSELYERSKKEGQTVVIISIDMDNLKIVNDTFGHAQGDVALQEIARAMEYAANEGDACARTGGDEFTVVGIDYDEEKAKRFVDRFQSHLEHFNEESGLPYLVGASYGYYIVPGDHAIALDAAIVKSDNNLYENKRAKKADNRNSVFRESTL